MTSFHKILCPIDFSPGSQRAARMASRLANEHEAELVLMHAWYVPPTGLGDLPFPGGVTEAIIDDARRGLDAAVRDASGLGVKHVSAKLASGSPERAIVTAAGADPAIDLVVLGTHGRTGLRRVVLGSIAEYVVRHAPCSVLTIRPDARERPFARLLVPLDFSDSSRHALELAVALARPGGAGLTLLHSLELPVAYTGEVTSPELAQSLDARAHELLTQWAAQLTAKLSVPIEQRTRIGRAGAQILTVLDDDPSFDLVVMGTHGHTGLARMLGSVAEKVVRHAPCPVLVARHRS